MTQDQLLSLVRAAFLAAGVFLIKDADTATDWTSITGAVCTIISVAWSMFAHASSKETREKVGSTK